MYTIRWLYGVGYLVGFFVVIIGCCVASDDGIFCNSNCCVFVVSIDRSTVVRSIGSFVVSIGGYGPIWTVVLTIGCLVCSMNGYGVGSGVESIDGSFCLLIGHC